MPRPCHCSSKEGNCQYQSDQYGRPRPFRTCQPEEQSTVSNIKFCCNLRKKHTLSIIFAVVFKSLSCPSLVAQSDMTCLFKSSTVDLIPWMSSGKKLFNNYYYYKKTTKEKKITYVAEIWINWLWLCLFLSYSAYQAQTGDTTAVKVDGQPRCLLYFSLLFLLPIWKLHWQFLKVVRQRKTFLTELFLSVCCHHTSKVAKSRHGSSWDFFSRL